MDDRKELVEDDRRETLRSMTGRHPGDMKSPDVTPLTEFFDPPVVFFEPFCVKLNKILKRKLHKII